MWLLIGVLVGVRAEGEACVLVATFEEDLRD